MWDFLLAATMTDCDFLIKSKIVNEGKKYSFNFWEENRHTEESVKEKGGREKSRGKLKYKSKFYVDILSSNCHKFPLYSQGRRSFLIFAVRFHSVLMRLLIHSTKMSSNLLSSDCHELIFLRYSIPSRNILFFFFCFHSSASVFRISSFSALFPLPESLKYYFCSFLY